MIRRNSRVKLLSKRRILGIIKSAYGDQIKVYKSFYTNIFRIVGISSSCINHTPMNILARGEGESNDLVQSSFLKKAG